MYNFKALLTLLRQLKSKVKIPKILLIERRIGKILIDRVSREMVIMQVMLTNSKLIIAISQIIEMKGDKYLE